MDIIDVHTHHLRTNISQFIYSCMPTDFSPQKGGYYSVGIHPWKITSDVIAGYEQLEKIARHPQVLAIGETGLDKMIRTELSLQQKVFEFHINLAEILHKPLIIHSVKTSNEIIQLKKKFQSRYPWILHGFRGKKELAEQLTAQNIYLSFGEKYQEAALNSIPLNRLLLETDESDKEIFQIYEAVAQSRSVPIKELIAQVQQNIAQLFFNQ